MKVVASLIPVPTYCANPRSGPTEVDLEAAYTSASCDQPISMLLLTNPHNPLGVVYSAETLLSCVTWARSKGIHVVVDEIYAMSVHQPNGNAFRSVLDVLGGEVRRSTERRDNLIFERTWENAGTAPPLRFLSFPTHPPSRSSETTSTLCGQCPRTSAPQAFVLASCSATTPV